MKKSELQIITSHLINKNQFLSDVQSQISNNIEQTNGVLENINSRYFAVKNNEDEWINFEKQFELTFPDFDKNLNKASNYTLTTTELKICRLLKIGFSNKIIANLLTLSIQTMETHVYNIHKKIELKDSQLLNWLENI